MPEWTKERLDMVERQLADRGIRDDRVLAVMGRLPREEFLPEDCRAWAYHDRAVPMAHAQTVSQPYVVAAMTEALDLAPDDRVLEIGTGSGYQTAVLSALASEVLSVERIGDLQGDAKKRLLSLGIDNVLFRVGDGSLGWPEAAPFDAIIVAAGAPSVPPTLQAQLSRAGGRLVIPIGPRQGQTLMRYTRTGNAYVTEALFECAFVPLVGGEGWPDPSDP